MKFLAGNIENPIPEIMNDELFNYLYSHGYLVDKAIRNQLIRKKFKELRSKKIRVVDAIDMIRDDYKFLQYYTIRKIVYRKFDKPRKAV